jgi:hypothetical protein
MGIFLECTTIGYWVVCHLKYAASGIEIAMILILRDGVPV